MKPALSFLSKIAHYPKNKGKQPASFIGKKYSSYSTTSSNLNRTFLSRCIGAGLAQSPTTNKTQIRNHHPSPFDPQTTKGWKAALKVL
jgi:hypothetical protein